MPTLVLMISLAVAMRILYVCTAQLSPFCWLNALSPKFSRLMLCIPSPLCSLLPQPTIPCKCKCNSFLSMLCNGHAASSEWYKIVPKIPQKRKAKSYMKASKSYPRKALNLSPPGQRPRHTHHHFAFAKTPEINPHADYIVKSRIRPLVQ